MCMKKNDKVTVIPIDDIVAKLKGVGNAFGIKAGEANNEYERKNILAMMDLFHTFANTISASYEESVRNAVSKRPDAIQKPDEVIKQAVDQLNEKIAQQSEILRGVYAERDELKRQLDALKGAAV